MRISDWSSDVCSSDLVRQLVRAAAAQGVPIVGYGAGTSLEGNAAAVTSDTLVVDFSRMNEIVEISPEDLLVVVQPGVTREQLNEELRSEEHTSELQSLMRISYAVFCLKKKKQQTTKQDQSN